jgi:hypothetical protein
MFYHANGREKASRFLGRLSLASSVSLLLSANGSRGASEKQVKWMEILVNRANGTSPRERRWR